MSQYRIMNVETLSAPHGTAGEPAEESIVHARELAEDVGWFVLIMMLLPLAIPAAALAFAFKLGQRLYARHRERQRLGFAW